AEDRTAGEDLSPDGRRLSIHRHTSRTLELGQQVEEQQHGSKRGLCGKELFEAEAIGAQVVLQLGNAILHVSASVVVPPDPLRRIGATGDKDAEGVARHVDQLTAYAIATLAYLLANHHEATLDAPAEQFQPKRAHRIVVVQDRPLLH